MVEDFRDDYNEHRPHSALRMAAPARFAHAWKLQHDPTTVQFNNPLTAGGPMNGVRPTLSKSQASASIEKWS